MQVHSARAMCETCSRLVYLNIRQVHEDQPEDGPSLGEHHFLPKPIFLSNKLTKFGEKNHVSVFYSPKVYLKKKTQIIREMLMTGKRPNAVGAGAKGGFRLIFWAKEA